MRVGQGFDAHRLVSGVPLVLAGVTVPHAMGLDGHSDGDVVLHAVADALLGALGEGDLGRHFPSSDEALRGIDSRVLLGRVVEQMEERGYRVGNVDVTVIDSLLSEEAVLGFEYGYATAAPETLVVWEAQFGDFANGAQVVIDQFITSGEAKWGRLCGLTMLLPHGYEGQGPEHSSARLERYLQLCADHNIQVCVPSTPAQMFHLLRRQVLQPTRKPLIVMTPKSLLRSKAATSAPEVLVNGSFQRVIGDRGPGNADEITRVVFCSGKIYYELAEKRDARNIRNVAVMRAEQLYPFPESELRGFVNEFPNAREVVWCQEEPQNQGAWYQIRHHLQACISDQHELKYVGRPHSASPAVGSYIIHLEEQLKLVNEAILPNSEKPVMESQHDN